MKFCLFGSGIYESLLGNSLGGSELQVSLLAKSLANNGHEVYVIENSKSNKFEIIDNVKVLFTSTSNKRVVRFIYQKLPNMMKFLIKLKPDYVYVRGISQWNLIPLFISKISYKTKFILAIPSDIDVLGFFKRFHYIYSVKNSFSNWVKNDLPSSLAYPILKHFSDILLCQHSGQYISIAKHKKKSFIFPNLYDKPIDRTETIHEGTYFIYVGSLNERKGLSHLKYLIYSLPAINFKIIGKPQGEESKRELDKLKKLKNVEYIEWLPNSLVPREISYAKALINVSKYEGFSNAFLEAWASGIPVISLFVNPGNIIIENNLGYFADGNIESMIKMLENFKNVLSGNKMKDYVLKNHSIFNAAERFLNIINLAENQ